MAVCNNCGHDNADGKVFCENCGSELGTSKILEQYSVDEPFSASTVGTTGNVENGNYNDYKTICLLAMIFGIAGFLINPLYLVSLAGIVLGIIGQINSVNYKTWAMVGWICGGVSIIVQFFFDLFCTAGIGFFC
ncbi:MAG: zinc-ribbon domain-containing protein [Saccharofermentans sp.]|nr:zinc-ribbon domain-containing protein [Saccharofermentans sp.]